MHCSLYFCIKPYYDIFYLYLCFNIKLLIQEFSFELLEENKLKSLNKKFFHINFLIKVFSYNFLNRCLITYEQISAKYNADKLKMMCLSPMCFNHTCTVCLKTFRV